jgi:peptide/nickel transport system ATP-binding protein
VILSVRNLKVYFSSNRGQVKAVDDVSLDLDRGEIVGLAGESGCGKSTLALAISRLIYPPGKIVGGNVEFEGKDILKLSNEAFRRNYRWKKMAMVFQGSMNGFTPVFTIGYQIREVLQIHGYNGNVRERAIELLKMVELDPDVGNRYPHELSGGQKQRAFIAMALALDPPFLIADEPTTALDVVTQINIMNLLKKLRKEKGISILLITHDLALISEVVDRVYVLYAGRMAEYGSAQDVFESPQHPYTKGLINSIPTLKSTKIAGIEGFMPDLANLPPGCKFYPRCPYVMEVCKKDEPQLRNVRESQYVSCWLY